MTPTLTRTEENLLNPEQLLALFTECNHEDMFFRTMTITMVSVNSDSTSLYVDDAKAFARSWPLSAEFGHMKMNSKGRQGQVSITQEAYMVVCHKVPCMINHRRRILYEFTITTM